MFPEVSLILAVYDPPVAALRRQLEAIAGQTSPLWECIVVDDASTDTEVRSMLDAWTGVDPARRHLVTRAVNGGIAAATNDGLDRARGRLIAIIDHDDVVHPDAVDALIGHFERHPGDGVVYSDEQTIDADGSVLARYAKPEWSPHRHLGHHYLAHLVAARRDVVGDLRLRDEFEPSQDYDFYLRVTEAADRAGLGVGHIARVLYSWRAIAGSTARDASEKPEMTAAVRRCIDAAIDRRELPATAETVEFRGASTTSCRLVWDPTHESVTVITVRHDMAPGDVNDAVAASGGDIICLVEDHAVHDETWARPLVDLLVGAGAGAVGPKVVDVDTDTLLSAGRVIEPRLTDVLAGEASDECGPWGALLVQREVSALAPLGFTTRRSTFESLGGLDSSLGLDWSVAGLCSRIAASGGSCVWDPHTRMALQSVRAEEFFGLAAGRTRRKDGVVHASTSGTAVSERFEPFGTATVVSNVHTPFEEAEHRLWAGEIDMVTSDVFDTLVTRAVATPSDLFVGLATRIGLGAEVPATVFAHARRNAEMRSRRLRSGQRRRELRADGADAATIASDPRLMGVEVGLDEIWAQMPTGWGDLGEMREHELDMEGSALVPIAETESLFTVARDMGVPVVLVSDIYLTAAELTRVLTAAGVDMSLVSDVVTSFDQRLGKAHGLLADTIARHGVAADRTLHLGDNEVADVATAQQLGAHAIHVDIARDQRSVPTVPEPLRAWSSRAGTDLGISATVRAVLVGDPIGSDPAFQFGVATVGPVLAGFARWVSTTTSEIGAPYVHCMLREGATIAELMRVTSPDGPIPVPLHVSRWVTMRAAVIDGTVTELHTALSRRADLSAEHVADAFGCDVALVRSTLGTDIVRPADVDDACATLADDDEMRAAIVFGADRLRRRVLRYLHARLRFHEGPIIVADIGWGGTIQEGLTRILRSDGIDNDVVGLYLAMSSAGEERVARGAAMRSYLPSVFDDPVASRDSRAIAHHADTIERVMTPAIGTLTDIDEHGEPVCRSVSDDPIGPSLAAAQRGLREVVARLADPSNRLTDLDDARWVADDGLRSAFAAALADVVIAPSRSLASALSTWSHDDVAGSDRRSIADPTLAAAVRFANVHDVDRLDPHGRRWIGGLAGRDNRPLVAQMQSRHRGVDLDDLVPIGPGGTSRLAAFEIGVDLARCQEEHPSRLGPGGWSVLHLAGDVESLRSLRFDAGQIHQLVDIEHFSIQLTTSGHFDPPRRLVDLTDPDLVFVDGHRIDRSLFAHRAGGHLLVQFDDALAHEVRHVEVTVGFRCITLDDDSPLLVTPLTTRITGQARRVTRAVRRRL